MQVGNGKVIGFLVLEVVLFALASLSHGGWLLQGFEHERASISEAVIATVLAIGLFACLARPDTQRAAALLAQGVAMIGVMVTIVMIAYGLGPKTLPDAVLQGLLLLTLVGGFVTALKSESY
jgi:hypothetical protein